jgi:putative FmdB family regulatory protein
MPIYEYKCDKCGDVYERIQGFSDEPLKVHDGCGGEVHRLISAAALQFKGSGWYITDYAKGSTTSQAGKGDSGGKGDTAKGDSASGKGDTGKSESKSSEGKAATTSTSTEKK